VKGGLFFSFFFHTFQGFRHWSWDAFALGIRNMDVFYKTGYVAIAAAALCTGMYSLINLKVIQCKLWYSYKIINKSDCDVFPKFERINFKIFIFN